VHLITWQMVSRAAGLAIIFSLLVAYLTAEVLGKRLDAPLALTFLSIGTALVGAESGWVLLKRNGSSVERPSDSDGPRGS
jgi:hypothetical protein